MRSVAADGETPSPIPTYRQVKNSNQKVKYSSNLRTKHVDDFQPIRLSRKIHFSENSRPWPRRIKQRDKPLEEVFLLLQGSALTKILDNINPGIYPARNGTRAVASDQVSTPISKTFLNCKRSLISMTLSISLLYDLHKEFTQHSN